MSTITNPSVVRSIMDAESSQLVNHISLGDSNSVRPRGWPHGIQWALLQYYGSSTCFSTGMFSFNETFQSGRGQWTGYSDENGPAGFRAEQKGVAFTPVPTPDALAALWDSDLDTGATKNHIQPMHYTLANRSIPISSVGGTFQYGEGITQGSATGTFRHIHNGVMYYNAGTGVFVDVLDIDGDTSSANTQASGTPSTVVPVDYTDVEPGLHIKSASSIIGWPETGGEPLTWEVWSGAFGSTDYASASPPAVKWMRSYISGTQQELFDFPAGTDLTETTTQIKRFSYNMAGYTQAGTNTILVRETAGDTYPKVMYFHRAVKTNATAGWDLSQLYDASGSTATKCNTYLNDMGDARIGTWLNAVGSRANGLGQAPKAVAWILFGVNDADGANDGVSADSKATYKTAVQGMITRLKAAWASAGWSASNLGFVILVSPPADQVTVDAALDGYRDAAREIAGADSQVMSVDISNETTTTELNNLLAMPAYDAADNKIHLEQNSSDSDNSYSVLSLRALNAMGVASNSAGNMQMGMGIRLGL